ncbi:MAG: rod shape-determining protein MreC [Alphaproteobacteria bacterium]|nr:rod shape-determining protein MreC [Alphaproteobacteria bacterium]MBL7097505.1 rod shape-determining protein MreC [Alphaproteobacteria bacterium]
MANGGWRIARNRGGAQLPLALLLAFAIALILIGKAQSNLFDQARADMTDFASPVLNAMRAPLSGVNQWIGNIGHVFAVYDENIRLREEVARLRQWQNTAIVLDDRVKRYQMLLHAVPDPALSSVMARVIGRSNHPFLQTMVLNAGTDQGVKPGQAVIDARGMIGRIYLAGHQTSWVILLTDLNSRIPVTLEPGNVQVIMAGDNSGAPALDMVSQADRPLRAGMQVVSSGDGGLLPPGLAIGTVVDDNGVFRVALLADSSSSEDVRVVDFGKKAEAPPGLSQTDLPAVAAGLPPAAPPPPMTERAPAPVAIPPGAAPLPPPKVDGKPGTAVPTATAPVIPHNPAQSPTSDDAANAGTNE